MLHSKETTQPKLLAKAVQQICEENHTGLLQVITKKVDVLSFDIKAGRIVSIKYRIKRNNESLQDLEAVKYNFSEGKETEVLDVDINVPIKNRVLHNILDLLGQPEDFSSVPTKTNNKIDNWQLDDELKESLKKVLAEQIGPIANLISKEVFARIADINVDNEEDGQRLSDEVKKILQEALAEKIGPIAKIICKQVFIKVVDVNTVINMLANRIPDINSAQNFKKETKQLLNLVDETDQRQHKIINELNKCLEQYLEIELGLPSNKVSNFIREALCLLEQKGWKKILNS